MNVLTINWLLLIAKIRSPVKTVLFQLKRGKTASMRHQNCRVIPTEPIEVSLLN